MTYLNVNDFHDSGMEFSEFHYFLLFLLESFNFNDLHDSGVEFYELHDFRDSGIE